MSRARRADVSWTVVRGANWATLRRRSASIGSSAAAPRSRGSSAAAPWSRAYSSAGIQAWPAFARADATTGRPTRRRVTATTWPRKSPRARACRATSSRVRSARASRRRFCISSRPAATAAGPCSSTRWATWAWTAPSRRRARSSSPKSRAGASAARTASRSASHSRSSSGASPLGCWSSRAAWGTSRLWRTCSSGRRSRARSI
mmetsp:Transcript_4771/g.14404  ORF Transcript_4771/g.14404 Transcript_4771/m.14404 type:complete len:204 (-) Transcript_4771:225-836(-)